VKLLRSLSLLGALLTLLGHPAVAQSFSPPVAPTYLGFDRNAYPGDANLETLRKTFSFTGYWLNRPPSARTNTWIGKRQAIEDAGFGFVVLFNGRLFDDLRNVARAKTLGQSDAQAAVAAARHEQFPGGTVIFLDQEQGGRMLAAQKAYIYTWVDGVTRAGFKAGVYCSGIAAPEDDGGSIVTADDIRQNAGGRKIVFWVTDDACPPAPGCAFPRKPPSPADSGIPYADVWQFAQSPKRKDVSAGCPANHNLDGNCYPPGVDVGQKLHVDVESATSLDPSHGRSH
jgi:hypothetical protein